MAQLVKIGHKWYSDFSVTIQGDTGPRIKRIRRALHTIRERALVMLGPLIETERAKAHGMHSAAPTWEGWKADYLNHRKTKRNAKTWYWDEKAIAALEKETHPIMLAEISPEALDNAVTAWMQQGVKTSIINRYIDTLKTMMHRAEALDKVPRLRNWRIVKHVEHIEKEKPAYTLEQLRKLLKICTGVWRTIVWLGARAGLRRSEMYWLEKSDLLWGNDLIWVHAKPEWQPKSRKERHVPMPHDLKAYLRSIPMGQRFVLGDERPAPSTMTAYFRFLAKKADVGGNIHRLRHTYASHLGDENISDRLIADALGHATTIMTSKYTHTSIKAVTKAVQKLPPLLR